MWIRITGVTGKTEDMQMTEKGKPAAGSADAVWRILGMAVRAGKVQTGSEAASQAVRRKTAVLILVALDIAENSARKILDQCRREDIKVRQFGSKAEIGHWTGHDERAVAAILDSGFARRIEELIDAAGSHAGDA